MEIKNTTFFLTGIAVLVLGLFVMTFDYPQIQYFEQLSPESYALLGFEEKSIHQRLLVEFTVGTAIFSAGAGLAVFSVIKKS